MHRPQPDPGRHDIWAMAFDWQPAHRFRAAAAELDAVAYGATWPGEGLGTRGRPPAGWRTRTWTRSTMRTTDDDPAGPR